MSLRCNASGGRCNCAGLKSRLHSDRALPSATSDHELWRHAEPRGRPPMVRSSTADGLCRGRSAPPPPPPAPRLVPSLTLMDFRGSAPPSVPAGAASAPASPADGRPLLSCAQLGELTSRGMVIQEGTEEDSSGVSSSSRVYVSDGGGPARPRTLELRAAGDQTPPSPSPDRAGHAGLSAFGSKLDLFLEILDTQERIRRVSTAGGHQPAASISTCPRGRTRAPVFVARR